MECTTRKIQILGKKIASAIRARGDIQQLKVLVASSSGIAPV
jgi:hypothetical protein